MDLFVSIIVATRNRSTLLCETLEALVTQDWPADAFEIIVADNGSTDSTAAVVQALAARPAPRIQYLYVDEPGKSNAVNAALGLAVGEILAFTDDDVVPESSWIRGLVNALQETGADFAAGRIFPRWEVPAPSWMSSAQYGILAIPDNGPARLPIGPSDPGIIPIGANMAVRRHVIDRIGGLRPDLGKLAGTLRTGEDHELFLRMLHAGCRGVYEPTARVEHFVPRARLNAAYCRAWLYQNGRDVVRLEAAYATNNRRWLGIPRYLWRQLVEDVIATVRCALSGDEPRRVAAMMRIVWFAGYARERWFGAQPSTAVPPAHELIVEGR